MLFYIKQLVYLFVYSDNFLNFIQNKNIVLVHHYEAQVLGSDFNSFPDICTAVFLKHLLMEKRII